MFKHDSCHFTNNKKLTTTTGSISLSSDEYTEKLFQQKLNDTTLNYNKNSHR